MSAIAAKRWRLLVGGLLALEVLGFALAVALHLGVTVFGVREARGGREAAVQAAIGVCMAATACGVARRARWTRWLGLAVHVLALAGYLAGLAIALAGHGEVVEGAPYNIARALLMAIVLTLLLSRPVQRALVD